MLGIGLVRRIRCSCTPVDSTRNTNTVNMQFTNNLHNTFRNFDDSVLRQLHDRMFAVELIRGGSLQFAGAAHHDVRAVAPSAG